MFHPFTMALLQVHYLCWLKVLKLCFNVFLFHSSLQGASVNVFRDVTFYTYFLLVLVELILAAFPDQPPLFSETVNDPVSDIISVTVKLKLTA